MTSHQPIILLVSLFFVCFSFSQDTKKLFTEDLKVFTLRCQAIGDEITDKNKTTHTKQWFEGVDKTSVAKDILQLENDIDHSKLDVTYHLILMAEHPWVYTFHFYNEATKTEFGQLFIRFNDKDNDLVDYLAFVSKEKLQEIDDRAKGDSGFLNIPPPPPPPPPPPSEEKKKNN